MIIVSFVVGYRIQLSVSESSGAEEESPRQAAVHNKAGKQSILIHHLSIFIKKYAYLSRVSPTDEVSDVIRAAGYV